MTDQNSRDYYVGRIARERELARLAADPGIANIHFEMADLYENILQRIDCFRPEIPHADKSMRQRSASPNAMRN